MKNALDKWIAKKGGAWKQSTRNSDGAVEALQSELAKALGANNPAMLAQAARQVRLRPVPVVARYTTMTDDDQVTAYTDHVKNVFRNHWNTAQPQQTGNKMLEGITAVHTACGIPAVTVDIKALPPGYNGFFSFDSWTIEISESKFNQYAMVYEDPPANTRPHSWFVNVAETLYHEGRHCEQWWHMTRYCVHGKTPQEVSQQLGVPLNIATAAAQAPMRHGDPLLDLTKGWFESVYGGARRGIVLHALGLKRSAHQSPKITPTERGGALIHEQYSGNLAEEIDAWGIQDLVRAKF